jgi:hypothetical protein
MIIKYFIFAIISTALNLIFQFISFIVYDGNGSLYIGMFVGTFIGFISKYFFDKSFVFHYDVSQSNNSEGKTFFLYTLTGVFTTAIFWGFEISFNTMFESNIAKYIGATVGLGIGYLIKFFVDRKNVFMVKSL